MQQRRNTHQRQLVLEAVQGRCDHPTADDIYLEVRARDQRISRATVYRNLHLLAEDGQITSVRVPGGERFDRRRDDHTHVVCRVCGAVADAPLPYLDELDEDVARATGYEVTSHEILFEGICPTCQKSLRDQASDEGHEARGA
jgi:Fe2+ or Zn2+ uptake regulation protein